MVTRAAVGRFTRALLLAAYVVALPAGCSCKDRATSRPPAGSYVNSIRIRMIPVPPGEFVMGSPDNEAGRDPDEGPRHRVTIPRGFYLAETETTIGAFRTFVDETGYQTVAEREGWCWTGPVGDRYVQSPGITWQAPGYAVTDTHPVACVTFADAVAFANWLSGREGLAACYLAGSVERDPACTGYRLPTESEHEYVARAGTATPYPCGTNPRCMDDLAWLGANSGETVHPVRRKKPTRWGFYDLFGNVWERVEWKGDYPADGAAQVDPPPPVRQYGIRGGGYMSPYKNVRSAARDVSGPIVHRCQDTGFRLARTIP